MVVGAPERALAQADWLLKKSSACAAKLPISSSKASDALRSIPLRMCLFIPDSFFFLLFGIQMI
jgi:hypothetical protein